MNDNFKEKSEININLFLKKINMYRILNISELSLANIHLLDIVFDYVDHLYDSPDLEKDIYKRYILSTISNEFSFFLKKNREFLIKVGDFHLHTDFINTDVTIDSLSIPDPLFKLILINFLKGFDPNVLNNLDEKSLEEIDLLYESRCINIKNNITNPNLGFLVFSSCNDLLFPINSDNFFSKKSLEEPLFKMSKQMVLLKKLRFYFYNNPYPWPIEPILDLVKRIFTIGLNKREVPDDLKKKFLNYESILSDLIIKYNDFKYSSEQTLIKNYIDTTLLKLDFLPNTSISKKELNESIENNLNIKTKKTLNILLNSSLQTSFEGKLFSIENNLIYPKFVLEVYHNKVILNIKEPINDFNVYSNLLKNIYTTLKTFGFSNSLEPVYFENKAKNDKIDAKPNTKIKVYPFKDEKFKEKIKINKIKLLFKFIINKEEVVIFFSWKETSSKIKKIKNDKSNSEEL